jgi:cytochrome d ubiquinol oxidase subunit I
VVPAVVANQAGWIAAEVGRQPWIVHPPVEWTEGGDLVTGPDGAVVYDESLGLRTTDAVSEAVHAEQVLASLILFGLIYSLLGVLWLFLLDRKIKHGPESPEEMAKRTRRSFLEAAGRRPAHGEGMAES